MKGKILIMVAAIAVASFLLFSAISFNDADADDEPGYNDRAETIKKTYSVTDAFSKGIYTEWTSNKYYLNSTTNVTLKIDESGDYGLTASVERVDSWDVRLIITGQPTQTGSFTVQVYYQYIDYYYYTYTFTVNSTTRLVVLHSGAYEMNDVSSSVKFMGVQHVVNDGTSAGDHVLEMDIASGSSFLLPSVNVSSSMRMAGWYTKSTGGTLVGSAGSSYTPTSSSIELYAQYSTNTLTIDGFVDGSNIYHLFTMNHGETFTSPVPIKTTPEADVIEVRPDDMSTDLIFENGYLKTRSGTVVTDEAGPHSFTVVASKSGYESVSQTFTVHIPIYSIQVREQTVVEGQLAYLPLEFKPNKSELTDLSTDTVTITATWIKTNGSTQVFTATNADLTSYGASIPIQTEDLSSTEVRYMSFYVKVQFKGDYEDYGSFQPTTTYMITLTPSSTVDQNANPTIDYFTIAKHPTQANYYIATAVNPQNVHTYQWVWGDGVTDNTTTATCIHNYQSSNGQVTLKLIVGNVNGKSNEYTTTVNLENGSYNAFIGSRWVSPQYSASATVEFGSGWPSVPTKYVTTNAASQETQYYALNIPSTLSAGQDLTFSVTLNGVKTTYYVGIFDPSTVETGSDKISVLDSSGYSVKFGTSIALTKILYDSTDKREILWTAYSTSSVNSTIIGTSADAEPEFNFAGNARNVMVKLTIVQQDKNTYNYYKIVAVPTGTDLDDGPTDESKKVNIDQIADMSIDIGVVKTINLSYPNVNVFWYNGDLNGLLVVIDGTDDATLTLCGTKAATYKVVIKVEFNDGTWGKTEFNVKIVDDSGWDPEHEPEERTIGLSSTNVSGPKGGDSIMIIIDAKNVKSIDWSFKDSDKDTSIMSVYLREGGDEFDWIRIVPYQVGTWEITLSFLFENEDYGSADVTVTGTESSSGDDGYSEYEMDDQYVESGMPIYIYLKNTVKIKAIEYDESSDLQKMTLKMGEEGQILYLEKVDDGKYHVKVKLYFNDDTKAIAEFDVTVGSSEPAKDDWSTRIVIIAAIVVVMIALIIIPRVI